MGEPFGEIEKRRLKHRGFEEVFPLANGGHHKALARGLVADFIEQAFHGSDKAGLRTCGSLSDTSIMVHFFLFFKPKTEN
jgi:hypothetical protein